jgi:hypothetical protein
MGEMQSQILKEPMAMLFDQCKENATESDGNLTEQEYYNCAYSIYGVL